MKNEMYTLINQYGLNNKKTIEESQRLDKKIVEEQIKIWEEWKTRSLIN